MSVIIKRIEYRDTGRYGRHGRPTARNRVAWQVLRDEQLVETFDLLRDARDYCATCLAVAHHVRVER